MSQELPEDCRIEFVPLLERCQNGPVSVIVKLNEKVVWTYQLDSNGFRKIVGYTIVKN